MMAKASDGPPGMAAPLDALIADAATRKGPLPVHLWNPPFCGDIDMRITRDGTWHYAGSPIGRPALVRLFASVLRHDEDRFVLVTPVEKLGITVEDAPFLAVELQGDTATGLRLRTNLDEWITLDIDHPLRFEPGPAEALKPYARVRDGLWALVTRPVFYELIAKGEVRDVAGRTLFGVASGPSFFPMMEADALDEFGTDLALG
ncbi:MAG: DUF1285 domain-containing protein [Janthinobacterium lividum]